jgi:hypothetical protein
MAADLGVLQLAESCPRASRARWRSLASDSAPSALAVGPVNAVLADLPR